MKRKVILIKISSAVRSVMRENRDAALGNTGILYAEVCKKMNISEPHDAPNPGSVYRIGLRFRDYGMEYWRGKHDESDQ